MMMMAGSVAGSVIILFLFSRLQCAMLNRPRRENPVLTGVDIESCASTSSSVGL